MASNYLPKAQKECKQELNGRTRSKARRRISGHKTGVHTCSSLIERSKWYNFFESREHHIYLKRQSPMPWYTTQPSPRSVQSNSYSSISYTDFSINHTSHPSTRSPIFPPTSHSQIPSSPAFYWPRYVPHTSTVQTPPYSPFWPCSSP